MISAIERGDSFSPDRTGTAGGISASSGQLKDGNSERSLLPFIGLKAKDLILLERAMLIGGFRVSDEIGTADSKILKAYHEIAYKPPQDRINIETVQALERFIPVLDLSITRGLPIPQPKNNAQTVAKWLAESYPDIILFHGRKFISNAPIADSLRTEILGKLDILEKKLGESKNQQK